MKKPTLNVGFFLVCFSPFGQHFGQHFWRDILYVHTYISAMPSIPTQPLDSAQLRQLWKASAPRSTERELLLEIARLHRVLVDARSLTDVFEKAWRETVGGQLVAIHEMRSLLDEEPGVVDWRAKVRVVSP